jgi:predicted hydrolase (HD superfamily)
MNVPSIRNKFSDPGFAAKIDRRTIRLGRDELGVTLDDHIANLIRFLASVPRALCLSHRHKKPN